MSKEEVFERWTILEDEGKLGPDVRLHLIGIVPEKLVRDKRDVAIVVLANQTVCNQKRAGAGIEMKGCLVRAERIDVDGDDAIHDRVAVVVAARAVLVAKLAPPIHRHQDLRSKALPQIR